MISNFACFGLGNTGLNKPVQIKFNYIHIHIFYSGLMDFPLMYKEHATPLPRNIFPGSTNWILDPVELAKGDQVGVKWQGKCEKQHWQRRWRETKQGHSLDVLNMGQVHYGMQFLLQMIPYKHYKYKVKPKIVQTCFIYFH